MPVDYEQSAAGSGGGTGDVSGPASATDNAIPRFNGTTGKALQNSVVIVSDTGAATGITDLTATGRIALGVDATIGTVGTTSKVFDFSTTVTDATTDNVFGLKSTITYNPSATASNQVVAGYEMGFLIPSSSTNDILSSGTSGLEISWGNEGSGDVTNGFALFASASHSGSGTITSELGAIYFNSSCISAGGITGTNFKDGNFGIAGQSGSALGTVARDYTYYAETPWHTGTMDQHYGLFFEDQEFGTLSWAIKTTGGKVEFNAPSGKDSLLYLSDDDVAHGMTSIAPTGVYGQVTSQSSTAGGLRIAGLSDNDSSGLSGYGIIGTPTPSTTTPAIVFRGLKKNGTTAQDLGSTDVLFAVINNGNDSFPNLWIEGGGSTGMRTQFPNARLDIFSGTSDSTASSLRVTDSGDGSAILLTRNDKRLGVGTSTLNSTLEVLSKTASSGITKVATFSGAAHTAITTATEANWVDINLAQTHTWTAGDITTQRSVVVRAETIAFTGASIVTNAATLAITGAPTAGANASITNAFALWVQGGATRLDGILDLSGISAGSPNIKITKTSDTPGVTFSALGTFIPDFAPSGYIEITEGGSSKYIPFWA